MFADSMQVYLVGGAVRDELLGCPVRERDWVVVGATPQFMLEQGFQEVGRDFPVFLHPHTKDEYALARTERKTAPGYRGFVVRAAPEVTLEEDLQRRDLTINALARDRSGKLVDPYGGLLDLEQRLLRHVSPAFSEDPVRILRLARFAARYAHLGFRIAGETLQLTRTMVAEGEVDALVPERVWAELHKALAEKTPSVFFQVLRACGALAVLFPEIDQLFGIPQPEQHHPEIDTGEHTLLVVDQAAKLTPATTVRFAALLHDLGKGLTSPELWPRHHGHEQAGLGSLDRLCARLRVPNEHKELARKVMQYHGQCHKAFELRAATVVDLLTHLDTIRRPALLDEVLTACKADVRGRTGFEETAYPQAQYLRDCHQAVLAVKTDTLLAQGLQGKALGDALRQQRIAAVRAIKSDELDTLEV